MKLKILSLVLIIMLVSLPVTHVMATPIQEDCQKAVTEDDLKTYIKNHVSAGHKEHSVVVDIVRDDFDPKTECHNQVHIHLQPMKTIEVKEVCKIQYKCLDQNGDKWRIDIEGRIGQQASVSWDDKIFWECAIRSPCATYEYSYTYDLNAIDSKDLLRLFNLMVSVDQYLDKAKGTAVLMDLTKDFLGGSVGIASTLVSLAKYGGKIPYIGEAVFVAVGAGFAIYALYQFMDELHKIDVLKAQTVNAAKNIRCCE